MEGWVEVAVWGTVLIVFCYGVCSAIEDWRKRREKKQGGRHV